MKNGKTIAICFILCLIFVSQPSWSENVDTNAAYLTVFGRPATAVEISYWQNRLPATQAELVQINLNWLVSARGAGELVNVINRGFQAALSRQPSAAELQDWQTKIKTEKLTYSAMVSALKGNRNTKLQVFKIPNTDTYKAPPAPKVEIPSAFPLNPTAPVVIACPENVSMRVGVETYPLTRKIARFTQDLVICDYFSSQNIRMPQSGSCPQKIPSVAVIGPSPNTTTLIAEGCKIGLAFCHRAHEPYSGGLVSEKSGICTYASDGKIILEHQTSRFCQGNNYGGANVIAGYSGNGKFLCW